MGIFALRPKERSSPSSSSVGSAASLLHPDSVVPLGKRELLLLAGIIAIALSLRIYRLDWQSGWLDEFFSVKMSQLSFVHMSQGIVHDYNPPLYYYALHLWMKAIGVGVAQARTFSMIWGFLSIPILFFLVRRLFGSQAGLLAAFLLSISQFAIIYSQEARCYSLTLFLSICTAHAFILSFERRHFWWAFIGLALLMFYTHYYTAFFVAGLALYNLLFSRHYGFPLRKWMGACLFWAAAYVPWLVSGVIPAVHDSMKRGIAGGKFHVSLTTFPSTINLFNNGKWNGIDHAAPIWTYVVGAVILTLPALLPFVSRAWRPSEPDDGRFQKGYAFFTILSLVTIGVIIAMSWLAHFPYFPRYIIFALAPYYAMVAGAILALNRAWFQRVWIAAVVILAAGALRAHYFIPSKPDYRNAVVYVMNDYQPGDCISFLPSVSKGSAVPSYWSTYASAGPLVHPISIGQALSEHPTCRRLWVLWDPNRAWLMGGIVLADACSPLHQEYVLNETRKFFEFEVNLWIAK